LRPIKGKERRAAFLRKSRQEGKKTHFYLGGARLCTFARKEIGSENKPDYVAPARRLHHFHLGGGSSRAGGGLRART